MSCIHNKIPIGTKFGRLTVTNTPTRIKGRGNIQYWCNCSCGKSGWFYSHKLKSGWTRSCGCYRVDELKRRWKEGAMSTKVVTTQDNIKQFKDKMGT